MSWLNPDKVPHSNYNPDERVKSLEKEYPLYGEIILSAFNKIDPLHVFYDVNSDEYLGYAERFLKQVGDRSILELKVEDIREMALNSFHKDQIGKFASTEDIENVGNEIYHQIQEKFNSNP